MICKSCLAEQIMLEKHQHSLDVCKQLIKEGRLEPAKVILDLLDENIKEADGQ